MKRRGKDFTFEKPPDRKRRKIQQGDGDEESLDFNDSVIPPPPPQESVPNTSHRSGTMKDQEELTEKDTEENSFWRSGEEETRYTYFENKKDNKKSISESKPVDQKKTRKRKKRRKSRRKRKKESRIRVHTRNNNIENNSFQDRERNNRDNNNFFTRINQLYQSTINSSQVIWIAKQISYLSGKAGTTLSHPCTRMNFPNPDRSFVINTVRLYRGKNNSRSRDPNFKYTEDLKRLSIRAFKRLNFVTHYYLLLSNTNIPSQPVLILHNVGTLVLGRFRGEVNPKHLMLRHLQISPFRISGYEGLESHAQHLCRTKGMNSCWEAADKLYDHIRRTNRLIFENKKDFEQIQSDLFPYIVIGGALLTITFILPVIVWLFFFSYKNIYNNKIILAMQFIWIVVEYGPAFVNYALTTLDTLDL